MRLIGRFIFHIFSNAIAILGTAYFIKSFIFTGNFIELLIAAMILTAINTFIKPILKLFFGPLILLTFGFFILIINALTLYILDFFYGPLRIEGLVPLFFATLIIGIINLFISFGAKLTFKKS